MKNGVFKSDWFTGLVIILVFLIFAGSDFIASLERSAYDLGVKSSSRNPSDKIAIIAIDDQSINNIGRWPWSRDIHAQMHDILAEAGAKAVGQTVFFSEPQLDPGLEFIRELKLAFEDSNISAIPELVEDSVVGQVMLVIGAQPFPVVQHGGRIVYVVLLVDEADDCSDALCLGDDLFEDLQVRLGERGLEEKILGGIARENELREGDQVSPCPFGLLNIAAYPSGIALEVANSWVHLGESNSKVLHEEFLLKYLLNSIIIK